MFMRRYFDIVLVDDEPDVLQISQIALRNLTYQGASLRLHCFGSKGAALEFLQNTADPTTIAMAMIDVVMESDMAGLELCSYIRSGLKNDVTQLIVRTGQAGKAPQRQILEGYEINGYIAKSEATQESLFNYVLGSLRNYDWAITSLTLYRFFNTLLPGFRSREELFDNLRKFILHVTSRDDALVCHTCFVLDGVSVAFGDYEDAGRFESVHGRLRKLKGRRLNDAGDIYTIEEGEGGKFHVLLALAQDPGNLLPSVAFVSTVAAQPSEFAITMWHRSLYAVRRFLMIADFVGNLRRDKK